jgi:uncharacterized protein HemY
VSLFEQAILVAQALHDLRYEGFWMGSLGVLYMEEKHYKDAEAFLQRALAIAIQIGDQRYEGTHLSWLGDLYTTTGQFQKARECLERAVKLAEDLQIESWIQQRKAKIEKLERLEKEAGDHARPQI